MDLRSILAFLRRGAPYLLVGIVVGSIAAFVVNGFLPRVYQGSATLLIGQQLTSINPDYSEVLASQQLSRAYAGLAETRPVHVAVIEELGLDMEPEDLSGKVRTVQSGDGTLVDIIAEDTSPETAAAIANAVADQIVSLSPSLRGENGEIVSFVRTALEDIQAEIETAQAELEQLVALPEPTAAQTARINSLDDRITSLRATYASLLGYATSATANLVTVFDRATVPSGPVSPRLPISLVIGATVGFLFALLVVGLRDYFDDSVKTPEDVEALIDLPTLGRVETFPRSDRSQPWYSLVTILHPRSPSAEAFRTLRTNLDFAAVDHPLRTILVTGSLPLEGKTTVAANLAVAFAQSGRSTILVDSDLRRPDIHAFFRLSNATGLTRALASRAQSIAPFLQDTEVANLRVLTAGPPPPNPAELIASQRAQLILEQLAEMADVVVLDSPPLSLVTDGALLASLVDGSLLVVRARQSRRAALRTATETLQRAGARILGVALNGIPKAEADAFGYHGYYDRNPAPQASTIAAVRVTPSVDVDRAPADSKGKRPNGATPPRTARTSERRTTGAQESKP
jgi:non-specific protein-tyrosine kinase